MNETIGKRLRREVDVAIGERDRGPGIDRALFTGTDFFFEADSPLGRVCVAAGNNGVKYISRTSSSEEFIREYRARFERLLVEGGPDEDLVARVEAALFGERVAVVLDLSSRTPFQRRVMEVVRGIPRGEARPYSWVAYRVGKPRAARAVGTVMATNPLPLIVPCHRIVRNDGSIGSYGFGTREKARLLEMEGVSTRELARYPYVGSSTTKVVCHATCRHAQRISPRHHHSFHSMAEAIASGFRPCRVCEPVAA